MKRSILLTFATIVALGTLFPMSGFAQSGRSVPVTVENLPDVVATEDVDRPSLQPVQFFNSDFIEVTSGSNTLLFTGEDADPVPEGKRLVVQHVSFSLSSENMPHAPLCAVRVLNGSTEVVNHPVPTKTSFFRDSRVERASLAIAVYVDAGMTVGFVCSALVSEDVRESFAITGYYVDM